MSREQIIMKSRIRNVARWITRNLERTFQVASTVVLFDDHSTDGTEELAARSVFPATVTTDSWGWVARSKTRELHYLHSPYGDSPDEYRDHATLWWYCRKLDPRFVLCLDGDEMLSRQAVREFPELFARMARSDGPDLVSLPFIYTWDGPHQRRVDGYYGDTGGPDDWDVIQRESRLKAWEQEDADRNMQWEREDRADISEWSAVLKQWQNEDDDSPYKTVGSKGDALKSSRLQVERERSDRLTQIHRRRQGVLDQVRLARDQVHDAEAVPGPRIRVHRLFTTLRLTNAQRIALQISQSSAHHSGVPMEGLCPAGGLKTMFAPTATVVHFGYEDASERQRKFAFYTARDPGNEQEGCYRHIVGLPNWLAPGPVRIEPWEDL